MKLTDMHFNSGAFLPPLFRASPIVQELALASHKQRHWRVVPCSTVTGEGLLDGFQWIVQDISARQYYLS